MKKFTNIFPLIIIVSLVLSNFSGTAQAASSIKIRSNREQEVEYKTDEIIVKFKEENRFRKLKLSLYDDVPSAIKRYRERFDIEYAEPNYLAHAFMVPNDSYYGYQWHLDNTEYGGIHAETAWDTATGTGVVVAILDTGIAYEDYGGRYQQASDLAATCFVPGYDFVNNNTHPSDDNGHGTHLAGTIAQSTNNNLGVAGIAFNSCLMPIKVLDRQGRGTYADIAEGVHWAVDHGAQIINLSLGGRAASETLENAVAYAYGKGVTVIAAAGNGSSSNISYPAAYNDYVIAVGATCYDETLAYYSNFGAGLDLVAPGGDLRVDQNGDGYGDGILQQTFQGRGRGADWGYYFFQGTSMAAAHVSGAAALVISNGKAITPDEVRTALESTTEDLGVSGWDDSYGWGLVDAAAFSWTLGPEDNPPINTPPVAAAGPDQTVLINETVDFDGSASYDPDGSIISYEWDFGDGNAGSGITATHVYTEIGSYTVTLTVVDDEGSSAQDTAVVAVEETPALNIVIEQMTTWNTGAEERYYVRVYVRNNEDKSYPVMGHLQIFDPNGEAITWPGMEDKEETISSGDREGMRWRDRVPSNALKGTYTVQVDILYQGVLLDSAQTTFLVQSD